jgi:hypothetical protein
MIPIRRVLIVDRLRDELAVSSAGTGPTSSSARGTGETSARTTSRGPMRMSASGRRPSGSTGSRGCTPSGPGSIRSSSGAPSRLELCSPVPLSRSGRIAEYCLSHAWRKPSAIGTSRRRRITAAGASAAGSLADARSSSWARERSGKASPGVCRGRMSSHGVSAPGPSGLHSIRCCRWAGWPRRRRFRVVHPGGPADRGDVSPRGERVLASGKGAHLMNVGRGGVVEEAALLTRWIAGRSGMPRWTSSRPNPPSDAVLDPPQGDRHPAHQRTHDS